MTDPAKIAERYIAAWNETDAGRRQAMLAEGWTESASYLDPIMQARGHDEIGAMIGAVHQRFPGFRFSLEGKVDGYGDQVRFSWALGPAGAEGVIKGTDFAVVEGGRLKSVTGFLDLVPASA
ncbi:nuclear transport factor 2 family protein [Phenylobacterium montanum]|uniref:Nuclear transport factor 2 family protein n=1 Tax=Phenylobacterium montanum TaxID=2823693 RepID=A0A975G4K9_9CAUL|nr:nuclear transport factor 2 family protein [Caulobacter sp. S6]QUD90472.1 nuclear transport factor 2 family protein [Caulobacter sp. S6]